MQLYNADELGDFHYIVFFFKSLQRQKQTAMQYSQAKFFFTSSFASKNSMALGEPMSASNAFAWLTSMGNPSMRKPCNGAQSGLWGQTSRAQQWKEAPLEVSGCGGGGYKGKRKREEQQFIMGMLSRTREGEAEEKERMGKGREVSLLICAVVLTAGAGRGLVLFIEGERGERGRNEASKRTHFRPCLSSQRIRGSLTWRNSFSLGREARFGSTKRRRRRGAIRRQFGSFCLTNVIGEIYSLQLKGARQ